MNCSKCGCEIPDDTIAEEGYVKAFPRPDSELISRERAESATGTCWCNNVPFTDVEKEDITRYIILGAEIQRDYMVVQGWRKVPNVEWLYDWLGSQASTFVVPAGHTGRMGLAQALHVAMLKGSA